MPYTLADLRTLVLQRADMENSSFVGTTELTSYINDSTEELFDLLVTSYGEPYFSTQATVVIAANASSVAVGATIYKLLAVHWNQTASLLHLLQPYNLLELPRVDNTPRAWAEGSLPEYGAAINAIAFHPLPSASYSVTVTYVPMPPRPTTATQPLAVGFLTWAEYIICDAARKCLDKQRSDSQHLVQTKAALLERIKRAAQPRDLMHPQHTSDVQGHEWARRCDRRYY